MKKSLIMLTALLAVSSLAACGGSGSSSSDPQPTPVTDWTEAEKALMKAELGGNVLPFYYVKDQVVSNQYLGYGYPIVISAQSASLSDLKSYATKFVAADYTVITAVGSDPNYPSYGEYALDISKTESLDVVLMIGDGSKESGAYEVQVTYSNTSVWPERELAAAIQLISEGTKTVVPALADASAYVVENEMLGYDYFEVDCYVSDALVSYNAYVEKLSEAKFTFLKRNSYGAVFYSEDGKIEIVLNYDEDSKYVSIKVEEFEVPLTEWPTEGIAAAVKAILPESEAVVPEVKADGYYFNDLTEDYDLFLIEAFVNDSEALKTEYAKVLVKAGYKLARTDSYGYEWYTTDKQDLAIEIKACPGYLHIYCEKYLNEWPSEIATLAGSLGITVDIPKYEAPGISYVVNDYVETYSCFLVGIFGGVFSEYCAILKAAGWIYDESSVETGSVFAYDSTKNAMMTVTDKTTYVMLNISHYADPEFNYEGDKFPTTLTEKYKNEYCEGKVEIPSATGTAFESFMSYDTDVEDYVFFITVYGGSVADYKTTLTNAGFEYLTDYKCYYKSGLAIYLATSGTIFQIQAIYYGE